MNIKTILLAITISLFLTGCDSNDEYILTRVIAFGLGTLIISFFVNKRNIKYEQKDNELRGHFNKKKPNKSDSYKNSSEKNTRGIAESKTDKKNSKTPDLIDPIATYCYAKEDNTLLIILIIAIFIFVLGFAFNSTMFYVFSGMLIAVTIIVGWNHYFGSVAKYRFYTYKVYNDRLECYKNENTPIISILFSDIVKIDSEYEYTSGRGGREIDKIFYLLKNKNGFVLHKMEVKWLRNFTTKKSFIDEFSELLKNNINP
jgi:hypothetical protein